jgi:hypothetical protein
MLARVRWIGFLCFALMGLSASPKGPHPFHVGVVEVEYNAAAKQWELSCKLFTDDFENALRTRFQVPVNLSDPARHAAMDTLVARYLRAHLSFKTSGRALAGRYLGFEQDKEAIYAYIEYPDPNKPAVMLADCDLLYEQFTDQINIFHVTVGGKRQSSKLNHPARAIEFRF